MSEQPEFEAEIKFKAWEDLSSASQKYVNNFIGFSQFNEELGDRKPDGGEIYLHLCKYVEKIVLGRNISMLDPKFLIDFSEIDVCEGFLTLTQDMGFEKDKSQEIMLKIVEPKLVRLEMIANALK